jgi:hypothetical protein
MIPAAELKVLPAPSKPIVAIRVRSVPSGAHVLSATDGSSFGNTPLEFTWPSGRGSLSLKLELAGWTSIDAELPLGDDVDRTYVLDKDEGPSNEGTARAAGPSPSLPSPSPSPSPARAGRSVTAASLVGSRGF